MPKSELPKNLVVHGSYHKAMCIYFQRTFKSIAEEFGLNLHVGLEDGMPENTDLFLDFESLFTIGNFPNARISHIIRDPRDMVVSGYFYHLHCDEPWVDEPSPLDPELTYREILNNLDFEDGLIYEMMFGAAGYNLENMGKWNFNHPQILELKYEDLISDHDHRLKEKLFQHYGFSGSALKRCVEIMDEFSFEKYTGRKLGEAVPGDHLRQGLPGDWRQHFSPKVSYFFESRFGPLLSHLGYGGETG